MDAWIIAAIVSTVITLIASYVSYAMGQFNGRVDGMIEARARFMPQLEEKDREIANLKKLLGEAQSLSACQKSKIAEAIEALRW